MEDLLAIPTLYFKRIDYESEGEAVKRKSPTKRHPVPERPRKKRKMVRWSPISIKQTSEPIFNFEVSIDFTTPHSPVLKNISLASEVTTPLRRDVSSISKETSSLYIQNTSSDISVPKPLLKKPFVVE